jgi:5'-phosphate synthase pdxT subunit
LDDRRRPDGGGPSDPWARLPDEPARTNSELRTPNSELRIGVLALQGDFAEHAATLRRLGAEPVEVRLPAHLEGLDGLIIPGGESTTIGKLMVEYGLFAPLRALARSGFPVYGSCAGMILLARRIEGQEMSWLDALDISVRRNAFGRQIDSFEADLAVGPLGDPPYHAVFIRAPRVSAAGPAVETLARLEDGTPVAVRQGNLLATSFHPELTPDDRFHRYFLDLVTKGEGRRTKDGHSHEASEGLAAGSRSDNDLRPSSFALRPSEGLG